MIILGLILLIVGFLVKIAIVWTIGIVVLVIGLILVLLGAAGRGVGGRRHVPVTICGRTRQLTVCGARLGRLPRVLTLALFRLGRPASC